MNIELLRLMKSKRQSFEWRTSYAEKFSDGAREVYAHSAAVLFAGVPCLRDKEVLAVYDHAIKSLEAQ